MKHQLWVVIVLVFSVGMSCKLGASAGGDEYKSAVDKFSVVFPAGSSGVETGTAKRKYAGSGSSYSKHFDSRSDNYRSYEVQIFDLSSDPPPSTFTNRDILAMGLNGWDKEPETVLKDATINGQMALDSVRSVEIGPAKMTFREVVFWSDADKKMYVLQISAVKKENVSAKDADDFVNSFKLGAI